MPKVKVTPEIEQRIIQLHRANQTYKNIGRQLGLDWRTAKGVVNRVARVRDREHWEAVTRQVDAELLRQHYSVLMVVAQEVRAIVSLDPVERVHEIAEIVLEQAQSRAVQRAIEHGMLPGVSLETKAFGIARDIRLADHGHLLLQSLEEHEPQLKTLAARWAHSWDSLVRERGRLTTMVKKSLLNDEEAQGDLEKQGLSPLQAADTFNAVLTEALEYKLKGLKLMEFETPTEGPGQVIRRIRKDPYSVRGIYPGGDLLRITRYRRWRRFPPRPRPSDLRICTNSLAT